ncbi:MAG: Lrp/AsnC family transcriptional regulator, partial [Nanoarchaeota archaeon]
TLDRKDRRILYALDINSRQPNSEIAKKVGLSKQVVGFRIRRLMEKGIISSFYTVIDISKLGYTAHKNFVRLQNVDNERLKEIIEYLRNHPQVIWLASCDGRFDLVFSLWARNMAELDEYLTEINQKFGVYISERELATIIKGEYFIRDYIISNKPSGLRKSFFGAVPQTASLDSVDWRILQELGKSSRFTAVEIAQAIKSSADIVRSRIRKLEQAGVIRHYNIVPNEAKYPFMHYKILMSFRNLSEERERSIIEYCRILPNVVYIVKALGPWEFEMDLEVESPEKYRQIMMRLKTEFADIIKDYSALHLYQVHKYNFCPSIPSQES